jgi:hypothetical protein
MVETVARLHAIADHFERRANQITDLVKQAELMDTAVKSRFLISEIARLFELAKKIDEVTGSD